MAANQPHGIPNLLTCPRCGTCAIDLREYRSLMALSADLALFALDCPHCGAKVSTIQAIPPSLREAVGFAAVKAGAGMGHAGKGPGR